MSKARRRSAPKLRYTAYEDTVWAVIDPRGSIRAMGLSGDEAIAAFLGAKPPPTPTKKKSGDKEKGTPSVIESEAYRWSEVESRGFQCVPGEITYKRYTGGRV